MTPADHGTAVTWHAGALHRLRLFDKGWQQATASFRKRLLLPSLLVCLWRKEAGQLAQMEPFPVREMASSGGNTAQRPGQVESKRLGFGAAPSPYSKQQPRLTCRETSHLLGCIARGAFSANCKITLNAFLPRGRGEAAAGPAGETALLRRAPPPSTGAQHTPGLTPDVCTTQL